MPTLVSGAFFNYDYQQYEETITIRFSSIKSHFTGTARRHILSGCRRQERRGTEDRPLPDHCSPRGAELYARRMGSHQQLRYP